MEKTIMCGVDVHAKTLAVVMGVSKGPIQTMSVPNTDNGKKKLFDQLIALGRTHRTTRIVVAYEASCMGFGLYDECKEQGIDCHVLAPTKIPCAPKDRKVKTDAVDAFRIFELVRGYVQMLLKRHGIRKPDHIICPWTKQHRRWLEHMHLPSSVRLVLDSMLRQIDAWTFEKDYFEMQILTLSKQKRYAAADVLMTKFYGVGLITSMTFLTELGDLRRFSNRKQLGSYLGLAPCSFESGEASDRKGHITRSGPGDVRAVLCQAIWAWLRSNQQEKTFYEQLVMRNPRHKKKAVVACMRRLAVRMWHTVCSVGDSNSRPTAA